MFETRIRLTVRPILLVLLAVPAYVAWPGVAWAEPAENEFDKTIAPVLARRCLGCHNKSDRKGGLDLSAAKGAQAGGESGTAIVPGKVDESLLWEKVSQNEMPPKNRLPDAEKDRLRAWIAGGAKWGSDPIELFRYTSDSRAGYDWWALQPVRRSEPPPVRDAAWGVNAIDRFVLAALEVKGLRPSLPADKRTLIRRLSFDLIGLPPTPEEVAAFLADDSLDAYAKLVDRLLDSPHYGERWARHWLDIVRFGESQGFERDKLRTNAWPYRDWVVEAFNYDLPYNEFIRLQLAGDALLPDDPQGVIATGFLVAAPYDEVGQSQQSAAMKAVVRQDELEDIVGVTGQTFLGLTVHCARCHDHKFDPISQVEYYRLSAALAGVRHGERESLTTAGRTKLAGRVQALQSELAEREKQLAEIDDPAKVRVLAARKALSVSNIARTVSEASQRLLRTARQALSVPHVAKPGPIARWEFETDLKDSVGSLHGTPHGQAKLEGGRLLLNGTDAYVATAPLAKELKAKTLEVSLSLAKLDQRGGAAMSVQTLDGAMFDALVFAEREPGQWLAGSNFFARTTSFQGQEEKDAGQSPVHLVLVYRPDRTIAAYRNGRPYGKSYTAGSLATFEAGKSQVLFGLRHSPPGGGKFLAAAIDRAALYDRALTDDEVAVLAGGVRDTVTDDEILAALSRESHAARGQRVLAVSRVRSELQLLSGGKVYAVTPSVPELTHLLDRGDPKLKKEVVTPGAVKALSGMPADFGLAADAPDAERRIKLSEWIADARNPLTARVMANRLWHYHFGVGIVDTPNDFGFNGGRPTHAELLDWLAAELAGDRGQEPKSEIRNPKSEIRNPKSEITIPKSAASDATPPAPPSEGGERHGWSLKRLHRLIVLSATYRQGSRFDATGAKLDASNRLLWRKSPQRLEAEVVRDAVLVVAGELNPAMGGPGFQDFNTFTRNTQFYEPADPIGSAFHRRSLYRTWVRSGRSEFLDVFDCPDPSTTTPRRAVTTTPLQALTLLNNSFMLRMAGRFAERVNREGGPEIERQIARAYLLAYSRSPQADEVAPAKEFIRTHGLAAYCRVLFNSNEFLYVD